MLYCPTIWIMVENIVIFPLSLGYLLLEKSRIWQESLNGICQVRDFQFTQLPKRLSPADQSAGTISQLANWILHNNVSISCQNGRYLQAANQCYSPPKCDSQGITQGAVLLWMPHWSRRCLALWNLAIWMANRLGHLYGHRDGELHGNLSIWIWSITTWQWTFSLLMTVCSIQEDIWGVISLPCMAAFYNGGSDGEAVQQILKKMGDDKFPLCLILQRHKNVWQEISPFVHRWWEEPILKYNDPLTS